MNIANSHPSEGNTKQWPDFYSILDSSPEVDTESLRRSINTLYVKANEQSDHRELNTRFYNQVLTQKVLPQCRRILLNETSRVAYDRQWHLHREGAEAALSYQDFIKEISKDAGTARALLLSDDEISLLPSFSAPKEATDRAVSLGAMPLGTPVLSATPKTEAAPATEAASATEIVEGEEVIEAERSVSPPPAASRSSNAVVVSPHPVAPKRQKTPPILPILGGVLVLGIGGFFWNASRQTQATGEATPASAPAPVVARPATQPAMAPHPFVFKVDRKLKAVSLVGSFNKWDKTANPMVADADGVTWRLNLPLSPGRYVYKFAPFAPEEQTWAADPGAPLDPTDKVNRNSLLIISDHSSDSASPLQQPLLRLNTLALNADFETGQLAPWVVTAPLSKKPYIESAPLQGAKSGNNVLTFWDSVPYEGTARQTIKNLQPGKYTFRAWSRRTGDQEKADMFVEDYGGSKRTVLIPAQKGWVLASIQDIEVKNGQCTIGWTAKAPAFKNVQVDAVEFFRQ